VNYPFPGNVRELEALVYDSVARHDSGILSMESFITTIGASRTPDSPFPEQLQVGENRLEAIFGHFPTIIEVEEFMFSEALKRSKGNQGIAANLLGISRQTLNKRLRSDQGE
jgi:DNA-binding NtrC family response regulator